MFFLLLLLCVYVCREWERKKKSCKSWPNLSVWKERLQGASDSLFFSLFSSIPFLHREPHAVPLQRFSVFNWCVY